VIDGWVGEPLDEFDGKQLVIGECEVVACEQQLLVYE